MLGPAAARAHGMARERICTNPYPFGFPSF